MDAGMFQQTMFSNPTVDLSVAIQATLTLIIDGYAGRFLPGKEGGKHQSDRSIESGLVANDEYKV